MGVQFIPTDIHTIKREAAGKTAASLMFVQLAESNADAFDTTTLCEHAALFDHWVAGISYQCGQVRVDETDGGLYRCLADHDAVTADKVPSQSARLWQFLCNPAEPFPEWFPAIGRADAWMRRDRCSHAGKHWRSTEDFNAFVPGAPGVSSWEDV